MTTLKKIKNYVAGSMLMVLPLAVFAQDGAGVTCTVHSETVFAVPFFEVVHYWTECSNPQSNTSWYQEKIGGEY